MRILRFFLCMMAIVTGLSRAEAATPTFDTLAKGGGGGWVNTARPLTAEDFQGRIVLLDFWTYGCINCMQVVPDLAYLEEKFPELLVVGVHSAKYKGESLSPRIRAAAERFGIRHPVMNDSDFAVWNAFGVKAWPTFVLLDGEGKEIARYAGEGHRADLERDIAKAVAKQEAPRAGEKLVADAAKGQVLSFPSHITFAPKTPWGNVFFVGDTSHHRVVGFDGAGKIKVIIGSGTPDLKDGDLKTAAFNRPRGVVVVNDILYVADTNNHALRSVDLKTGEVKTLAGDGTRGHEIASPWDVELMADGQALAVAMAGTHQLYKYDIQRGTLEVLAGSGREEITDGPAEDAALAQPSALSLQANRLFFVDAESSSLRELTPEGQVKTLIGTGLFDFGLKDGKYPEAMLQHAQGLFAMPDKIYIADTYNDKIRVYDLQSGMLSTLNIDSKLALSEPGDIYVQENRAYVADTGNHRIVEIDLATGAAKEITLSQE